MSVAYIYDARVQQVEHIADLSVRSVIMHHHLVHGPVRTTSKYERVNRLDGGKGHPNGLPGRGLLGEHLTGGGRRGGDEGPAQAGAAGRRARSLLRAQRPGAA